MSVSTTSWLAATWAIGAALWAPNAAADIYRSEAADGGVRYASQALDASYTLYLADPLANPPAIALAAKASLASKRLARLAPLISQLSARHGIETALVQAVIEIESGFNPMAVSRTGATGAMQLMPATAARFGVTRPTDPAQNIEAGIRYLKNLLERHHGNVALALASYNAGEGAVARHGSRIPPFKETMLYVPAVLARLQAARNSNNH
jgi:soluble lytic murein transglycosylase-like protein